MKIETLRDISAVSDYYKFLLNQLEISKIAAATDYAMSRDAINDELVLFYEFLLLNKKYSNNCSRKPMIKLELDIVTKLIEYLIDTDDDQCDCLSELSAAVFKKILFKNIYNVAEPIQTQMEILGIN